MTTMYHEIYCLKHIFKLGGFLGIFRLETTSFMKYVHLILYLTFNLVGFICTPIEIINTARKFEMKIQEIFLMVMAQIVLCSINMLFIHGVFKKNKSWKQLFDIVDTFSTDVFINLNPVLEMLKIYLFIVLSLSIQLSNLWLLIDISVTFADIMSFSLWLWTYLQCSTITVTILKISKILTLRYSSINSHLIMVAFSRNKLKNVDFSTEMLQFQRSLYLLKYAVSLVNNIMGKILFIMITSAFLSNLSFINFTIFIYQTNKLPKIFCGSVATLLCGMEMFVSKSRYFFHKNVFLNYKR